MHHPFYIVYSSVDWDVRWGYGILTHGQMSLVQLFVLLHLPGPSSLPEGHLCQRAAPLNFGPFTAPRSQSQVSGALGVDTPVNQQHGWHLPAQKLVPTSYRGRSERLISSLAVCRVPFWHVGMRRFVKDGLDLCSLWTLDNSDGSAVASWPARSGWTKSCTS